MVESLLFDGRAKARPAQKPRKGSIAAAMLGLLAALLIALLPGLSPAAELPKSPLQIVTADGKTHDFTIELADTDDSREHGLMFRETLAPDAGMLFDFKQPKQVAFWMKNTPLPLDMLFIDAGGRIVSMAERTVPQSLTPIGPGEPVLAVLKVNGGTAARLGIKPGDKVIHPIFRR
jgi:uncharacterized membrane protein (UPF0127 family)